MEGTWAEPGATLSFWFAGKRAPKDSLKPSSVQGHSPRLGKNPQKDDTQRLSPPRHQSLKQGGR